MDRLEQELEQLRRERLAAVGRDHDRSVIRALTHCFAELSLRDDVVGHLFRQETACRASLRRLLDELAARGVILTLTPRYTGGRLVITHHVTTSDPTIPTGGNTP